MSGAKFLILILLSVTISCRDLSYESPYVPSDDEEPKEEVASICGEVTCMGKPIPGVVVSDGVQVVQTDETGSYEIYSQKKNSLVFISVPSGYTVRTSSTSASQFWRRLEKPADQQEKIDFVLAEEDQSRYQMIIMGDIHLYDDISSNLLASTFVPEVNEYVETVADMPVYGLTLGDMTWDWYWYDKNFSIEQYLPKMDLLKGIAIYNTVGNHDHDMRYDSMEEFLTTGEDWTCMTKYRQLQGPTCFSYNIGGVHYVSLDNVITIDTGGTDNKNSRGNWRGITETDMEWLKRDLSYVSDDTPVVVSVHIPLFDRKGKLAAGDSRSMNAEVADIVGPFKKFRKVLFISAHTHIMYNVENNNVRNVLVTEWNTGAVCGNFWDGAEAGMNICADGSPGGYRIMTVQDGVIADNLFKATGKNSSYLFRTYDRNQMNMSEASLNGYTLGDMAGPDSGNWVYIKIWDFKPSWRITVKEGDKELPVTKFDSYDPLYMLMYSLKLTSTKPKKTLNMFKVQASAADSPLSITVTDDYGRKVTETMARPKSFDFETYRTEQAELL